jgi:hypothetical protein
MDLRLERTNGNEGWKIYMQWRICVKIKKKKKTLALKLVLQQV